MSPCPLSARQLRKRLKHHLFRRLLPKSLPKISPSYRAQKTAKIHRPGPGEVSTVFIRLSSLFLTYFVEDGYTDDNYKEVQWWLTHQSLYLAETDFAGRSLTSKNFILPESDVHPFTVGTPLGKLNLPPSLVVRGSLLAPIFPIHGIFCVVDSKSPPQVGRAWLTRSHRSRWCRAIIQLRYCNTPPTRSPLNGPSLAKSTCPSRSLLRYNSLRVVWVKWSVVLCCAEVNFITLVERADVRSICHKA